jgi:cysteine-rich repeat protein
MVKGELDVPPDGKTDLVLAGFNNSVSVLKGTGSSTFAITHFTAPNPVRRAAIGDISGDGRPDIIFYHASNATNGAIQWLEQSGMGSFTLKPPFAVPGMFTRDDVAAGNFDTSDAALELAVSAAASGVLTDRILILKWNGSTFLQLSATNLSGSAGGGRLVARDFDADLIVDVVATRPDVVDAAANNGTVTFFKGDGAGGLTPGAVASVGQFPGDVTSADFDNDGKPDAVAANQLTGPASGPVDRYRGSVTVRFGDIIAGTFAWKPSSATLGDPSFPDHERVSRPFQVEAANLVGDVNIDLVSANADGSDVTVWQGDGTGAFTLVDRFGGSAPAGVRAAQFDGDATVDLAVAHLPAYVHVHRRTAAGTFSRQSGRFLGGDLVRIDVGQINAPPACAFPAQCDTFPDVFTAANRGIAFLNFRFGAPGGDLVRGRFIDTPPNWTWDQILADVDGDGDTDVMSVENCGGTHPLRVMLNDGAGLFPALTSCPGPASPILNASTCAYDAGMDALCHANQGLAANFFPGGSPHDVLLNDVNNSDSSRISVLRNLSAGGSFAGFDAAVVYQIPDALADNTNNNFNIETAELNGDSQPDLVISQSQQNRIAVVLGDPSTPPFGAPPAPTSVTFHCACGRTCFSSGAGTCPPATKLVHCGSPCAAGSPVLPCPTLPASCGGLEGSGPYAVKIADLDGDGLLDIIVAQVGVTVGDFAAVGSSIVSIFPGVGSGGFGSPRAVGVGIGPISLGVGNFSGSSLPDLAVGRATADLPSGAGLLAVLENVGSPGSFVFGPVESYSLPPLEGNAPQAGGANIVVSDMATGDFDQNGTLDVLTMQKGGFAGFFRLAVCGNSIVESGEQCDDGNTMSGDCCSLSCQSEPLGNPCPDDGNVCTTDLCDGAGTCAHAAGNAGTGCRASAGACDLAESCNGTDANCPADAKSTALCRAAAGACDLAESCDGIGDDCPTDAKSTAVCRAAAGACDLPESCNGTADTCPADIKSTAVCRAAAGFCDLAESCNGTADTCPADIKSTAVCRAAAGFCDLAENCNGSDPNCPADLKSTAVCRAAAGVCDVAESCDGSNPNCPANVFQPSGTACDDGSACTLVDQCNGMGVCVGSDSDGDDDMVPNCSDNCPTVPNTNQANTDTDQLDQWGDACDNCPTNYNPDQWNSDCDSDCAHHCISIPGCQSPAGGCCDGGDLCDACPAWEATNCDPNRTAKKTIGSAGGTLATLDGSLTLTIPPGALPGPTSISVQHEAPEMGTDFNLAAAGATVFNFAVRPQGHAFTQAVTIVFKWPDANDNGYVDNPSGGNGPLELNLVLRRDGRNFSKLGFNNPADTTASYRCGAHLDTGVMSPCEIAVADCNDPPPTDGTTPSESAVANCCDPAANTWTFQTCDFSQFFLGITAGGLIRGGGRRESDCMSEWPVNNPFNTPYFDSRGFPNFKQRCRDGDPLCDRDGAADGKCRFEVGVCLNVADPALPCTPSQVGEWRLKKPRPDSSEAWEAANAVALRDAVLSLAAGTVGGTHQEVVTFSPPLGTEDVCTGLVGLDVPLRGPAADRPRTATVKTHALTAPGGGSKDTDKLKLICLPSDTP